MARESVRDARTGEALRDLPSSHWKQYRDVRRPGRPDVRIDHVLVGPSGIHVIAYRPATATADPAVGPCAESAGAVAALLPDRYRSRVRALVCLRNQEPVAESAGGVLVTSLAAVEHILRGSPVVLSTCEVNEIAARLEARLQPFPVESAEQRRPRRVRRTVLGWAAAAAVVAGAVTLGPELVDALRVW